MSVTVKRVSIFAAVGISVVLATYDGWLSSRGMAPGEALLRLYNFTVAILLATWLIEDARVSARSGPSFDYGWFVMWVFPIYLPYYLYSTRRWRGLLILVGMLLLFLLPAIAESLVGDVS
jgi:hypothetical protein